ncbi:MAG: hypothetical protein HC831_12585 [Chloroflexia bacterium]|nr:hypothetical protein [Chloroflexia bacterium]
MFRATVICLLVLIMQTGFYIKAGNQVKLKANFTSILSDNLSKDVLFVVKHSKSPNMVVYEAKELRTTILILKTRLMFIG